MTKTKQKTLKLQVFKQLKSFSIFGKPGKKRVTKKQLVSLLKKKRYSKIGLYKNKEVFCRKTWPDDRANGYVNTSDFTVVILGKETGSRGLISTERNGAGLYDDGKVQSFDVLYFLIEHAN